MEYEPDLQRPHRWKSAGGGVVVFGAILLALSCAYMPVLQGYYAHHDDFLLWRWQRDGFADHPVAGFLRNECGRPIAPYLLSLHGRYVTTLRSANVARFASLVNLAMLAFLTQWWLRKHGVGKLHAILFVIAAAMLPAYQSGVGTISNGHQIAACLMAFVGTILAWKASELIYSLGGGRKAIVKFAVLSLLGGGGVAATLMTYQPAGMIYWFLLAVPLLTTDLATKGKWLIRYVWLFVINGLSMGVYFLCVGLRAKATTNYSVAFATDLDKKIDWFFSLPLRNAMNFWNLWPSERGGMTIRQLWSSDTIALTAAIVIVAGILADFIWTLYSGRAHFAKVKFWISCLLKYVLVGLFVPLCYLANIAASGDHDSYRTLSVLSLYLVFLLFWAVYSLFRVIPQPHRKRAIAAVLLVAVFVGAWTAHSNLMNYYALSLTMELRYIKARIAQAGPDGYDKILVLRPEPIYLYSFVAPKSRYDEFAIPATGFEQDVPDIITCVIQELNRENRGPKPFKLLAGEDRKTMLKSEFKGADERTLVIDMTIFHGLY